MGRSWLDSCREAIQKPLIGGLPPPIHPQKLEFLLYNLLSRHHANICRSIRTTAKPPLFEKAVLPTNGSAPVHLMDFLFGKRGQKP